MIKFNLKKEKSMGIMTKPFISKSGMKKLATLAVAGIVSINVLILSNFYNNNKISTNESIKDASPKIETTLNADEAFNFNDKTYKVDELMVLGTKNYATKDVHYQIVSLDISKETFDKVECETFLSKIYDLGDDDFITNEAYMYINDYKSVLSGDIVYRQMHAHIQKEHDSRVFSYVYDQNTLVLDNNFSSGLWQIETNRYGEVLEKEALEDATEALIDEVSYTVNTGEEIVVTDNSLYEVNYISLDTVLGIDNANMPITVARLREIENKLNNDMEDFISESKTI